MNNKKGGFGAKFLLVLILMIASAVGGAYGYRVLDGKLAVKDADKFVDAIRISDYDTEEAVQVETLKEEAVKNLETATTRKEVYEILDSFKEELGDILTKTEKELAEARQAVSDAQKKNQDNDTNNDTNNDNSTITDDNSATDTDDSDSSNGLIGNLFGNDDEDTSSSTDESADSDSIFN